MNLPGGVPSKRYGRPYHLKIIISTPQINYLVFILYYEPNLIAAHKLNFPGEHQKPDFSSDFPINELPPAHRAHMLPR